MKIEHLVATTNMEDFKLYSDLNLKTSAIIANQNGKNEFKKKINNNSIIKIISTDTKGVGKNRNLALMFADSDICILSDDDMKYEEISEVTGTSVGALKASYHHAFQKIQQAMEELL